MAALCTCPNQDTIVGNCPRHGDASRTKTTTPGSSTVCSHPCMKCSPGLDVAVSYHPRRSYCDPHSRFTFNSYDGEHLHYTCRNCGYDWTGDTADAEPGDDIDVTGDDGFGV